MNLEQVLQCAGEAIFCVDLGGRIVCANPALAKLVGGSVDKLLGASLHERLHPLRRNGKPCGRTECPLTATLRDGKPHRESSESVTRFDGTTFPVEYVSTPLVEAGKLVGAVFVLRDITEEKQVAGQLLQAQKLESMGQLAAGIAHEINTPTQYVGDNTRFLRSAFADLAKVLAPLREVLVAAKSGAMDPALVEAADAALAAVDVEYLLAEVPSAVQQSLEGVERVAAIVGAMKEFSHPHRDEKIAVDIGRAIQSTAMISRNEWKYVAELSTELDASLPAVPCLPGELNQVVLNLIVNAAHAIADSRADDLAPKGNITISTKRDGLHAEIRIADTGTDIPKEIQHRVFDAFFTTKPIGKGTGQGLAIARSVIVDKHGGTINFETEAGRGTTFIIRLPLGDSGSPGEATA